MMKYIIGLTITSMLLLNTVTHAQKIYQWEDEGVDNYSNNPAEVPYELIYDQNKDDKAQSEAQKDRDLVKLSETLEGPSKEKLNLILEAETKIENIITVKKKELAELKSEKDPPVRKVLQLENFIFKAEHSLKRIRDEKDSFIRQNQNS